MPLGSIWHGSLCRHEGYSARDSGVDGMEVEAAIDVLVFQLRFMEHELEPELGRRGRIVDEVHFERIEEIRSLARALPICDPLVTFDTHSAPIVNWLRPLSDGISNFMIGIIFALSRRRSLGQQLAHWVGFRRRSHESALRQKVQRVLDALGEQLQVIVNEMRSQRPYIPRDSDDVLMTERVLCHSLGLPQTIVCDILDYAEYWVRIVDQRRNVKIRGVQPAPLSSSLSGVSATIPESVKSYSPVRRIIFTIEAGEIVTDSQESENSPCIWFKAMIGSDSRPSCFQPIMRNTLAWEPYKVHLIQWDSSRIDGPSADIGLQSWMDGVQPGSKLSLHAGAEYPKRFNRLCAMRMEIYCTCI
ncbi:hypothetical protein DAEQUDRAFT_725050 [Daedalea quercina L-15889]|uniref:Uncharacterized protein n=1 Tax=Daedalea quercina L-15889 TaxID=1314783 RepID=A0A165RKS9_9APHY|nr:hypothetical protein DAEQUDRAFT_725050 [Daedalea quercina L-15889]